MCATCGGAFGENLDAVNRPTSVHSCLSASAAEILNSFGYDENTSLAPI